jgi:hypothetical protein
MNNNHTEIDSLIWQKITDYRGEKSLYPDIPIDQEKCVVHILLEVENLVLIFPHSGDWRDMVKEQI